MFGGTLENHNNSHLDSLFLYRNSKCAPAEHSSEPLLTACHTLLDETDLKGEFLKEWKCDSNFILYFDC
jgi:hypothetical protein